MAQVQKILFSGSTNGRGIKVAATATAGTLIHTAHATAYDEIWLMLYNGHTADVLTTIEFGGVTVPDDNIILTVPYKDGLMVAVPGLLLTGSVVLRIFAATTNVIVATGYVNRYTV